ncbi:MAG: hypothetical protein QOJ15_1057 [Bradyrhizobium sp.]|jgi:hypothetical protein|nr:hypothetical protein [Bradyrhizobium sp.]
MPNVVAEDAPIWEGDGYRLIPSRFPPVPVYEGLTANDRLDDLVAVENLTNPRLLSLDRLSRTTPGMSSESPRLQNWNHAPFAYGNPEGSLFFDESRPCLELADHPQTALAISVARREQFLKRTREPPIGLDLRMLKTPVHGQFADLRQFPAELLLKSRRELGSKVPEHLDGVLYRPPERPTATCIAVLKASALGRSLQAMHYRYVWDGSRISLLYAFDDQGKELKPEALAGEANILAA